MSLSEIISDSMSYPFKNIKALLIYVILGIIASIVAGSTVISLFATVASSGAVETALGITTIIGLIFFIIVLFLIEGYALDIVKYGIERRNDGPGIEVGRQVVNAFKLIIVDIVYFIVPVIIIAVLSLFFRHWFIVVIAFILFIVFALANFMAKCRLAQSDSLGSALAIGEAIGDISKVGFGKLIATVIVIAIISLIILIVIGFINQLSDPVGSLLLGIFSVYFVFFYNRAIGLLYSD